MGLSRPLAPGVMAGLYCFGYRSDRPFAGMPKLHIAVGEIGQRIADQERSLPGDVVEVQHTARKIMVRIPLAALAQPQRVFINVSTRLGDIPFSSQPWRILELPGGAGVEAERPQREE
jgi:hypothetical protein